MLRDVWTDLRMDGKPDSYVAPCLRQAQQKKSAEFANSVDPDEAAHNELPNLGPHCLPSSLRIFKYDIAWMKPFFFSNFTDVTFVNCRGLSSLT